MPGPRQSRRDRLLKLLLLNRGRRVPLPAVQAAAGAQHGARLREIRALGYQVENVMERRADGTVVSFYVLESRPGETRRLFSGMADVPAGDPTVSRSESSRMRRRP